MRVSVTENWFEGTLKDQRAVAMTASYGKGELALTVKRGVKVARFTHYQEGRWVDILPPLWRVEVTLIEERRIVLSGMQRVGPRAPLQYQEWSCWLQERKT